MATATRIDALPSFSLPTAALVAGSIAGPALVGGLMHGLGAAFNPAWVRPGWLAALAAAIGAVAGALTTRPWIVRPLTKWPMTLFAGQGVAFAAVTLSSVLLYWAAQPGTPVVFGLVVVAGFLLAMFSQVGLFTRRMRRSSI